MERVGLAVPDDTWAEMEERHQRAVARDEAAKAIVFACPHGVTEWQNVDRFTRTYQHGDNPEARIEVAEIVGGEGDNLSFVAEWVERIHAYERPATEQTEEQNTTVQPPPNPFQGSI